MNYDALLDPFSGWTMAQAQTRVNADLGITRDVQDEFAAISHQRAAKATADGLLGEEIVALRVATKAKGKLVVDKLPEVARPRIPALAGANGSADKLFHTPPDALQAQAARYNAYATGDAPFVLVDKDEPIRPETTVEGLAKLPPLEKDGTVTAGNAPGVNDGAAAVVLASSDYARSHGLEALATIVDHADAAWDPAYLALVPAMAARRVLEKNGLAPSDIAIWEVNEAFAAVAWSTANLLGIDPRAINLQGGAVALGHPVGASGARIVGSVVRQLRRRGGGYGIAAICSGGGQGGAACRRRPRARLRRGRDRTARCPLGSRARFSARRLYPSERAWAHGDRGPRRVRRGGSGLRFVRARHRGDRTRRRGLRGEALGSLDDRVRDLAAR